MATDGRYESLLRKVAQMREEQQRRKGSEEVLLKRLKEEYGVTPKEAEREIPLLEKKLARLEKEREDKIDELKEAVTSPPKGDVINQMFEELKRR